MTLDIEKRDSWTTDISRGAWTRILTNLVGELLDASFYTVESLLSASLLHFDIVLQVYSPTLSSQSVISLRKQHRLGCSVP